jgi:hypothetical protein
MIVTRCADHSCRYVLHTGLRGAAALEVTVDTAAADMHSGMKGGSVQNANHALLQLLSGLWDRPRQVCVVSRGCIELWLR